MQTVSKAQFKSRLLEYLRKVEEEKNPLIITHNGKPVAKVTFYNEDSGSILQSLRKSVVKYDRPLEPVAENNWEAMS